jgi:transcription antitermination factor NusG
VQLGDRKTGETIQKMPLLQKETDLFPSDLLDDPTRRNSPWWAMYTFARQEKKLMRSLVELDVPFYSPTISRRYRAPNGRLRTSYEPLFSNYVFVCGEESERYKAVCTGSISRWMEVPSPGELVEDLSQLHRLISTNAPMAPERKIEAGNRVRVKNGPFKGFEGTVIRRENEIRLLIHVRYMGQGASVALDDCQLDLI